MGSHCSWGRGSRTPSVTSIPPLSGLHILVLSLQCSRQEHWLETGLLRTIPETHERCVQLCREVRGCRERPLSSGPQYGNALNSVYSRIRHLSFCILNS
ncbi:hypothetical protein GBAR_LOCUS12755, partial [Geodia barretti]